MLSSDKFAIFWAKRGASAEAEACVGRVDYVYDRLSATSVA